MVEDPRILLTKDFIEDCGADDDEEPNEKDNRDIVVNEHNAQKLQADDIEMKASLDKARIFVLSIWVLLIVEAWIGIAKPGSIG